MEDTIQEDLKILKDQVLRFKDLIIEKDLEISDLRLKNAQLEKFASKYYNLYTELMSKQAQTEPEKND